MIPAADFLATLRSLSAKRVPRALALTPAELSERWNGAYSVGTLANWRSSGEARGPAFEKIAGRVVYPIAAVEAYESKILAKVAGAKWLGGAK